ncbi:MAG TPA: UDP-N-acetylmuramate dehydrogenase, partial [Thiothrix sp.]|nr:UDP-N-acetylmuramate dehydrogenase [Thiothrix sp.]
LSAYNSFGVSAYSRYFMTLCQRDQCATLYQWRQQTDAPLLILGGGSNVLFTKDFTGLTVLMKLLGKTLEHEDQAAFYVKARAGENWHDFVQWTIAQGYAGLENLSLIPGTVGAAPIQNIGAYGVELKDRFHELEAFDLQTGEFCRMDQAACQFAYRDSLFKRELGRYLILSVTFRLPKVPDWVVNYAGVRDQLGDTPYSAQAISEAIVHLRRSKLPNPQQLGNAGSFFKNPLLSIEQWQQLKAQHPNLPSYPQASNDDSSNHPKITAYKTSAAWLIDQCGWKGVTKNNAGVYHKHALILTNATGKATGEQIWSLAQAIMQSVKNRFGLELEPEPRIL